MMVLIKCVLLLLWSACDYIEQLSDITIYHADISVNTNRNELFTQVDLPDKW